MQFWRREARVSPMLVLVLALASCDRSAVEPCANKSAQGVIEIADARNSATGAPLAGVAIANIVLNGNPLDTAQLRTSVTWRIERTLAGFLCTLPCQFGTAPGTYAFDASAQSFYSTRTQVAADYANVPAGCPASYGTPTRVALTLVEADSARASFGFVARAATGLSADIASITFDDGSGIRTPDLSRAQSPFPTRNAGTMRVSVVLRAPDTLAVGELDIPLRKDWHWFVTAWLYDRNPQTLSTCIQNVRSFALRRSVTGADSLYVTWSGNFILNPFVC